MKKQFLLAIGLALFTLSACAQSKKTGTPDTSLSAHLEKREQERIARNELFIKEKGFPRNKKDANGTPMFLHHVDESGRPIYYKTYSLQQAQNIKSARLWQGGGLGLNLQGQDMEVSASAARLGIWEPEAVRTTHIELGGRATTRDTPAFTVPNSNTNHANHVAGIMMATGIKPNARGQANRAKLDCYEAETNEMVEMEAAATAGMLVSNHSYGPDDDTTQALLGRYDIENALYDTILYVHPYYLPVFAAGNARRESAGRKYNLVTGGPVCKNSLSIAAVELIDSPGYTGPASVKAASFTSFGPTNDSRVKPDLASPGVLIYSAISQSDTSYDTYSGTSMASPGVAGMLLLLQQHYKNTRNGAFMRAATLKGLAIHTAEEAGPAPGPDAMFGWGFVNAEKAVAQLNDNTASHYMEQASLAQGGTYTKNFTSNGTPLRATICWTDLPGVNLPPSVVKDRTPRLINDLDLRIIHLATGQIITRLPWKLNALSPGDSATRGDNIVDNVEQIDIPNLPAGNYALRVTHKGNLVKGTQDFSIFLTGGATVAGIRNTPEFARNAILFPNPTNDGAVKIRFNTMQSRISIRVLNILGQVVYNGTESNTAEVFLKIEGAAGLYTVEVRNAQEELAAYMVSKQ